MKKIYGGKEIEVEEIGVCCPLCMLMINVGTCNNFDSQQIKKYHKNSIGKAIVVDIDCVIEVTTCTLCNHKIVESYKIYTI